MEQRTPTSHAHDWLGLQRLAALLESAERPAGHVAMREVIDRLDSTLEILGLVEGHTSLLRQEARNGTPHETMQLASDLRRLANRIEAIGDFLLGLGIGVIDLEEELLVELDDRIRRQSAPTGIPRPLERWAGEHAA